MPKPFTGKIRRLSGKTYRLRGAPSTYINAALSLGVGLGRSAYQATIPSTDQYLERRFRRLADQWRRETAHYSLTFRRAMHPAYQQIIGMGYGALPLILKELQHRPTGHWFWALNAISGEDPAQPEDSIDDAIQAWLQWGHERSYV